MALSTKNLNPGGSKPNSKREKIQALAVKHKQLFEKEGVQNPKFIPRMCYKHKGEMIIGFYAKEIYGGADIYTEFCSRDYEPEDAKRTLWKWEYNPEYATEYEQSEPHPATGDRRFLIPVDELINVNEIHEEKKASEEDEEDLFIETPTSGEDVPYDSMTLRDYAAIQWKEPVSLKPWLNDLIRKNFK
jgi:hypothetical protein